MKVKVWKENSRKEVLKGNIFKYSVRNLSSQISDKRGDFDLIQCFDWVNVVAITKENQIVLVKQFRNGSDKVTTEVPGGAIHPGEDPLLSAQRELKEEAGYLSSDWVKLGVVDVNPAFMTNKCYFYLAKNCEDTSQQELDPLEEIEIQLAGLVEVKKKMESGEISHSLTMLALSLYQLNLK
jgi:ADP-ribose pyrophosphatase